MKLQGRKECSEEKHSEQKSNLRFNLRMRAPGSVTLSHKFQKPTSKVAINKEGCDAPNMVSLSFPTSENKTTIEEFEKMDSSLLCHGSVTKHYMETSFHKHDIKLTDDTHESVSVPMHSMINTAHRRSDNDESKTSNSFELPALVLVDTPSCPPKLDFSIPTCIYGQNASSVAPLPILTPHSEESLEEENTVEIPPFKNQSYSNMKTPPRLKIKKNTSLQRFW